MTCASSSTSSRLASEHPMSTRTPTHDSRFVSTSRREAPRWSRNRTSREGPRTAKSVTLRSQRDHEICARVVPLPDARAAPREPLSAPSRAPHRGSHADSKFDELRFRNASRADPPTSSVRTPPRSRKQPASSSPAGSSRCPPRLSTGSQRTPPTAPPSAQSTQPRGAPPSTRSSATSRASRWPKSRPISLPSPAASRNASGLALSRSCFHAEPHRASLISQPRACPRSAFAFHNTLQLLKLFAASAGLSRLLRPIRQSN